MCLFSPSLYIISCIKNSHCIGGPNNCISEKKVKLAYLQLKKSSHLQQQLTSKCVIYHTICHTEARLCQKRKKRKKNHNWSFYLFHYFLPQALSTKSKCLFESRKRESSSGPGCGGLRDRLRWIRSKWVLCFCVNKRLYGFEVINHKILLCS